MVTHICKCWKINLCQHCQFWMTDQLGSCKMVPQHLSGSGWMINGSIAEGLRNGLPYHFTWMPWTSLFEVIWRRRYMYTKWRSNIYLIYEIESKMWVKISNLTCSPYSAQHEFPTPKVSWTWRAAYWTYFIMFHNLFRSDWFYFKCTFLYNKRVFLWCVTCRTPWTVN